MKPGHLQAITHTRMSEHLPYREKSGEPEHCSSEHVRSTPTTSVMRQRAGTVVVELWYGTAVRHNNFTIGKWCCVPFASVWRQCTPSAVMKHLSFGWTAFARRNVAPFAVFPVTLLGGAAFPSLRWVVVISPPTRKPD